MGIRTRSKYRQEALGFHDVPYAFMLQLFNQLEPADHKRLSQVNKFFQGLVLEMHTGTVRLGVHLSRPKAAASRRRLQTALTHVPVSGQLHVVMEAGPSAADPGPVLSSFFRHRDIALERPSDRIQQLTVKGMKLQQLMSPALMEACPQLHSLTLSKCTFKDVPPLTAAPVQPRSSQAGSAVPGPTAAQLQHVTLEDVVGLKQIHVAPLLQELPSLSTLTLKGTTPVHSTLASLQPLAAQLTSMEFMTDELPSDTPFRLKDLFGSTLKHLCLTWLVVDDSDLLNLLNLPALESLQVLTFKLQQEHNGRHCPWRKLMMTHGDIMALAHLPLPPTMEIHVGSPAVDKTAFLQAHPGCTCQHCNRRYLDALPNAMARIAAAGGLHYHTNKLVVMAGGDTRLLEPILPLLTTFTGKLKIRGLQQALSEDLIKTLYQHLSPALQQLTLSNFFFYGAAMPVLLPSLPPAVQTLYLQGVPSMFPGGMESLLTQVCVPAVRPVTLQLDVCCQPAGWQERVQAAMAAQGHQHVNIQVRPWEPEDSDGLDLDASYNSDYESDEEPNPWDPEVMAMGWGWGDFFGWDPEFEDEDME